MLLFMFIGIFPLIQCLLHAFEFFGDYIKESLYDNGIIPIPPRYVPALNPKGRDIDRLKPISPGCAR